MEEILKDQMQQALDNYCRTYRSYTEEDKFTFLLGYQAAINVLIADKKEQETIQRKYNQMTCK